MFCNFKHASDISSDITFPMDHLSQILQIIKETCEWDLNPVPLDQESVVFPLEHCTFLNQTASDVNLK